jgi:predicted nucleic acid-binding protein
LPAGNKRSSIEAAALAMFADDLQGRVLAFDEMAAASYAEIFARRRGAGRPAATLDLKVAAIAHSHGASIAMRQSLEQRLRFAQRAELGYPVHGSRT